MPKDFTVAWEPQFTDESRLRWTEKSGIYLCLRKRYEKAQQGARANTTGCHGSCSEQHAPRQPVVWLTFDVSQIKNVPAPPISRVALYVRDMRKVAKFYAKHFGFESVFSDSKDKAILSQPDGEL